MRTALILLLIVSSPAFAAEIADSDGGFLFDVSDTVQKPVVAQPLSNWTVSPPKAPVSTPPAAGQSGCPMPVLEPGWQNTPLELVVDQETQIAKVKLNGRVMNINVNGQSRPFEMYVSTGGGLKIPNGKIKKDPYCARTPAISRVVPAVRESDFDPALCTPDEIRWRATVFPEYQTNTFSDKNGNPIPMRDSVRVLNGIFTHAVPPSYRGLLGQNVSGECVRMPPNAAREFRQLVEKYGAVRITISEPPNVSPCKPQYCDDAMIEQAKRDIADGRIPSTRRTGSEGLFGAGEGAEGRLRCGGDNMRHVEGY